MCYDTPQIAKSNSEQGECGDEKDRWKDLVFRIAGIDPRVCPYCGKGKMVLREKLHPRRGGCPA